MGSRSEGDGRGGVGHWVSSIWIVCHHLHGLPCGVSHGNIHHATGINCQSGSANCSLVVALADFTTLIMLGPYYDYNVAHSAP